MKTSLASYLMLCIKVFLYITEMQCRLTYMYEYLFICFLFNVNFVLIIKQKANVNANCAWSRYVPLPPRRLLNTLTSNTFVLKLINCIYVFPINCQTKDTEFAVLFRDVLEKTNIYIFFFFFFFFFFFLQNKNISFNA